ncbi:MAG: Ig-like domain-containing protein, partial [Pirellulales bacterium]
DTAAGKIYWTDATSRTIRRADLNGANVENLVSTGLSVPAGIAIDKTNGKIYWTDLGTNKIQRANLNGTTVEDIVSTGLIDPRDVVVDAAGGKIYWTDQGGAKIQRANLNGAQVQDVLTTGLNAPTGLALDAAGAKLYFSDSASGRILRVDTAGTNLEAIASSLNSPQGVALDVAGGKVYWAESGKIKRSDLSGANIEDLIATSIVNPSGLALDVTNGRMYWTDLDTDKIQRSSLGVLQDAFDSNVATVTINVTGVNDPPVAFDDAYPLAGGALNVPAALGVLANDFDADGTGITASIVSGATRGVVVLNTNGAFVYTPNVTFTGVDSFTYRVFDGVGNSNIATVFITNRPIIRTENVTITAQSDASTEGFFDVYVDLAGAAQQVTGYEVQMRMVEQSSGITFVGAQSTAPARPALLPGQTPTVVGLGQTLQVTDFAPSGTVALANGRGLFRAHFVAEAGVVGTFHVTFDTGFTNISNSVAQAIPLGGLVTGTITLVPAANPAPQVAQVMISDGTATGWTPPFLNHLQATGRGDGGYAIPTGSAAQLDALPWDTLSTIKVRFTRDVDVDAADLVLNGVNVARYDVAGFTYDPSTFVATWQLNGPIANDKLLLSLNADGVDPIRTPSGKALDGEWENGITVGASGNGVAGGDFHFRFNVLPGDIDRNGRTNIFDTILVRDRQFTAIGDLNYSIFADLTGNGSVNIFDTVRTSNSQFKTLPIGEPVFNPPATPAAPASAAAEVASAQVVGLPRVAAALAALEIEGDPAAYVLPAVVDAALPALASDSAALSIAISTASSGDDSEALDEAFGDDGFDWSLGL